MTSASAAVGISEPVGCRSWRVPAAPPATDSALDDWIQAGYAILAEEGIKALKIDRLCDRLGVTKGSFYWHFDGMPSYRAALVESWGELARRGSRATSTRWATWRPANGCRR